MTSTASTGSTPAKPVEHAHKPQQDKARSEADKAGQASDLFAGLLALMGDTAPVATADDLQDTTRTDVDPHVLDPLASMLAWMSPSKNAAEADAAAQPRTAAPGAASATGVDAPRREGIDIEGMTRVDEAAPALPSAADKARAAAASRPAFSPLNPGASANAMATSSTTARAAEAGDSGSAANVVWQRAGLGTETLPQPNASSVAQVRSTVALNERFGLAGVPPELVASPPSQRDAVGPAGGAPGPALGAVASGGDTSTAGLLGAGASGDGGNGSNGDAGASAQSGDGQAQQHAEAGRETDAPTVTHWGTQHLRHASLRVGGEGSADAIDIRLQVQGQEVQVAFQTDNAEARAQLRESAGESLADLMQRSGIQLGNVSVGAQGQSQGGDVSARAQTGARTGAIDRAGAEPAAPTARPLPPRTDGSRPLDVFA